MAQLMFETIPAASVSGVSLNDKQTVLTVRSMLDSQLIAQPETGSTIEDSDVFQCGKCKKQFLSIEVFVNHKAECSNSTVSSITDLTLPSNVCGVPQNTVLVQKIQIPSSTLTNYPQSLVLTEADLLQLSAAELDPTTVTTSVTSNSNINVVPSHALMPQTTYTSQTLPATVQHVLQQVASQDPQHPQTVELSIINDKFISRPIFLTSQQANNAISSVVLNISNAAEPTSVLCRNPETDKSSSMVVESETLDSGNNNDQNGNDKEPSTVNIITEFHSSMVKTKKPATESENEENQSKKDNKLSCAYCCKNFTKNFDLQQHIRCHTGEKPFQCIVCGRAFAQKSNVKKHMQTHKVWPDGLAKTLPHLLGKNGSSCSDNEITQDHVLSDAPEHPIDPEADKSGSGEIDKSSYACPYCSYIGNSYYKLKSHMKQHDTEKVLIERYSIQSNKASFVHKFFTYQQPPNMPVSVFFAKASALFFKAFCMGERNRDIEEANRIEKLKFMLLTNLAPEIRRGIIAANPKTIDEIKEAALLQERAWNSYRRSPNCSISNKTYPSPVYAVQQLIPTLIKEEAYQQPVTNITEKAFSGFEKTLQRDIEHTCARNQEKTDISAELVLSNDEESSSRKEAKREDVEKSSKDQSNLKAEKRDRTLEAEISVWERETSCLLKSEWSPENRLENKRDQESNSIFERGHDFDTGRGNYSSSSSLQDSYPILGSSSVSDYVEIRNKHIEGKIFERAQKLQAEEVKHWEQNKWFAHEKSKSFEKCNEANDMNIYNAVKSQHNSESKVDKYPNRKNRIRDSNIGDRSQSQHTQFPFSRRFRQNVPLRFQKQQIEFCQQKSQRTVAIPSSESGPARFIPSHVRFSLFR
ncbi:Zinc finger protein 341 [Araneus ventricosus]|uniref:Zinc finger protein 341 n=1 Tax=Araneus ventricosus TaxID=182803 RepID=A0A4Y2KMP8_ARAVE|nr:Zinc finger protein 341 [Araneus ventricosus]